MHSTHIAGVDPGIIHTGVVELNLYPAQREILLYHEALVGMDAQAVLDVITRAPNAPGDTATHVFVEGYRPRQNLTPDRKMQEGVAAIRAATGGKVLDNMGVKKIITPDLMKVFGVWTFSTTTHHQDLRSAARIALLGAVKDDQLNPIIADIVRDYLDGNPWTITQ